MPIKPSGIIVHSMGEFIKMPQGPVKASDFIKSVKLSVHGYIHPDGTYEKQVDSPNKAFHAGKSLHEGVSGLNSHYLGFELLVPGEHDFATFSKAIETPGTYTQAQFDKAVAVCKHWMKQYNIPVSKVVRHSDVSGDNVRGPGKGKTDPGSAFLWEDFKKALSA